MMMEESLQPNNYHLGFEWVRFQLWSHTMKSKIKILVNNCQFYIVYIKAQTDPKINHNTSSTLVTNINKITMRWFFLTPLFQWYNFLYQQGMYVGPFFIHNIKWMQKKKYWSTFQFSFNVRKLISLQTLDSNMTN